MIVRSVESVPAEPVVMDGAKDATVRWLITDKDGAPTFAMRLFEVLPGGHTPHHNHPYEHELYVLSGSGTIVGPDGGECDFKTGDVIFVQADEMHQFRNSSEDVCKFLCLIPVQHACTR